MKRYGSELIFVSQIGRDGKAVFPYYGEDLSTYSQKEYELQVLSFDCQTYIATDGNSFYVVKLKNPRGGN